MIRLLHTADWQLGAPGVPPSYFETALHELRSLVIGSKIDIILCAGDIFDQPRPDQKVKDLLLKTIIEMPVHWVFTIGNHDYTDKAKSYHSLIYLKILEKEKKLDNIDVLEPGESRVILINSNFIDFCAVKEWEDFYVNTREKNKFCIGCWHGIVPGLDIKNLNEKTQAERNAEKAMDKSKVDYIALGDIHQPILLHDRCGYPGSLIDKTYSDTAGVIIVKLDEPSTTENLASVSAKIHQLGIPRKITLDIDYTPGKATERDIIGFVRSNVQPQNFVKVKFNLPISAYNQIDQQSIREALQKDYLEVRFYNNPILEDRTRLEAKQIKGAQSIQDEVRIVVENGRYDLDQEKLIKFCGKFILES